jgi:hypothetical protein
MAALMAGSTSQTISSHGDFMITRDLLLDLAPVDGFGPLEARVFRGA